jgi:dUTP pyrophosphatase
MNSGVNNNLESFLELCDQIAELPDEALTDEVMQMTEELVDNAFNEEAKEQFIQRQVTFLYQQNLDKVTAVEDAKRLNSLLNEVIDAYGDISERKKDLMRKVTKNVGAYALEAAERYRGVEKKIYFQKLHPNAKLPTYAHQEDACADLYAPEDITIHAGARGMQVKLGLAGAIPSGWQVQIHARSGMSAKTPLRISNQVGILDSSFLGEWVVLFDNIGGSDYTISAGDRIAQMSLEPVYYFAAEEVADVHDIKQTDRDSGGLGSSGK